MRRFTVEVKEILSRVIDVEANSAEEAISKVQEMYDAEEIVLDYDDFKGYDILPYEG